jgi:uncharacterized protein (DUF488 family)
MPAPRLVTIGYEGRTADEVVAELRSAKAEVLVDVRLTPLSRKPGMSKRRLSERLREEGLEYRHVPSLGNPKENREPFRANDPAAIERFRGLLNTSDGTAGVNEVAELMERKTVALLCFEREWHRCHRRLIADRLSELHPGLTVRHV